MREKRDREQDKERKEEIKIMREREGYNSFCVKPHQVW